MCLKNKTTIQFRTVYHGPLYVPDFQVPQYLVVADAFNFQETAKQKELSSYQMRVSWRLHFLKVQWILS